MVDKLPFYETVKWEAIKANLNSFYEMRHNIACCFCTLQCPALLYSGGGSSTRVHTSSNLQLFSVSRKRQKHEKSTETTFITCQETKAPWKLCFVILTHFSSISAVHELFLWCQGCHSGCNLTCPHTSEAVSHFSSSSFWL